MCYDPLIAKLIAWGSSRDQAIRRMQSLEEYTIVGISSTIPFHAAVMRHQAFHKGETDTGFIERNRLSFMGREEKSEEMEIAAVSAAIAEHMKRSTIQDETDPSRPRSRWNDAGRLEQLHSRLI